MILERVLWTACITPFKEDAAEIDYASLDTCLRTQEKSGNGIVLLGSTGEGLSVTETEKRELLTHVCGLGLRVPILVGISGHDLSAALALLDFCKDLPIHGYLVTTPMYTRPGILGQTAWFEKLLNNMKHPAVLYNVPSRVAVKLYPETVKNLRQHEKFIAIKDASGTVESVVAYNAAAENIAVFCGDDQLMPAMASVGACGLVSIAANVWPDAVKRYVLHSLQGKKVPSNKWWHACHALSTAATNPIPIKVLMKAAHMIEFDTVRLPLSVADISNKSSLLAYHKTMSNWTADA